MTPVLTVEGLRVAVRRGRDRWYDVLDGVDLTLQRGQCLGIVGESGCGKSLTLRAAIGLLPAGVRQTGGTVSFAPAPDAPARPVRARQLAGHGLAMVFQDPNSTLDPTMRVGSFLADVIRTRKRCGRREARSRAVQLLHDVGVPAAEVRYRAFPHELSGGLRQRVAVALALATEPQVLLCDEPTTALDVTLQAQLLQLLDTARRESRLSLVFVSHDLAVVRQVADVVAVMYAGQIVEYGAAAQVFDTPRHPYTRALLDRIPAIDRPAGEFTSIPGAPPDPSEYDRACRFRLRCAGADGSCLLPVPGVAATGAGHVSNCVHEVPEVVR